MLVEAVERVVEAVGRVVEAVGRVVEAVGRVVEAVGRVVEVPVEQLASVGAIVSVVAVELVEVQVPIFVKLELVTFHQQ